LFSCFCLSIKFWAIYQFPTYSRKSQTVTDDRILKSAETMGHSAGYTLFPYKGNEEIMTIV
jgi:hypothetical protein